METPGQSETIIYFDDSVEADKLCMRMNVFLQKENIPETEIYYALEMEPNVPEPE